MKNRIGPHREPRPVRKTRLTAIAKHEQPEETEIDDLYPSLITPAERADRGVPWIVVRASRSLDEKHDHEEKRADRSAEEQDPGR
jgi:hypothetical protein